MPELDAGGWRGFHIFYHGDLDRLIVELVRPLVADLLREGGIRRFFWIRYRLGGPHVRLRLDVAPGREDEVAARVRGAAARYFRRRPSNDPIPPEVIRRENGAIARTDPIARDFDDVVPDQSVLEVPPRFEIDRYGGLDLLEHSLDFFVLSSIEALGFLARHRDLPGGQRLARAARLLIGQAWGHASDAGEFAWLLGYAVRSAGGLREPCCAAADQVFEARRQEFCRLMQAEIVSLLHASRPPRIVEAARGLAHAVLPASANVRGGIAGSQLHMTMNRVGLANTNEVYLSRILVRAAHAIAARDEAFWNDVWDTRRSWMSDPSAALPSLVSGALAELANSASVMQVSRPAAGCPSRPCDVAPEAAEAPVPGLRLHGV